MLRASLLLVASTVVPLSVFVACNDVETRPAADAGNRVCDPGPFVYSSVDEGSEKVIALGSKPSAPACSSDGTNLDVINRLPRGGFYLVGWKVQTVGTEDTSGQGECSVIDVCTCVPGDTSAPAPTPVDAGSSDAGDAGDAAAPAPAEPNTAPHWKCG